MTSVTDGFQLCRARICGRPGMSVSQASLPGEPGGVITQITPKPFFMGFRSGTAGGMRPSVGEWSMPNSRRQAVVQEIGVE
jgi:hypothetical protein